jgi:3-phenylpropionate/cinnamic acid dioxygenase small subunit
MGPEQMELWELVARESIRDLVARYNANGDAGRFEQVLEVFADDAVMELVTEAGQVRRYEGTAEIATIFSGTKAAWDARAAEGADTGATPEGSPPTRFHVRHVVGTHQIDLEDRANARGRSYFVVLMPHGLDHWGRYIDRYGVRDGRWLITSRRAVSDGRTRGGFTD